MRAWQKVVIGGLVTVVGVFVVFPVWYYTSLASDAKRSRVEGDFSSIGSAIKMYAVNNGQPPSTDQGLEALVSEPKTDPKPKRWNQIMSKVPEDPWGTPYRYGLLPPKEARWRWELRSAGPDKVFGNRDDFAGETQWGKVIVSGEEGGEKGSAHPSS